MRNDRLMHEVKGLRSIHERTASGLPPLVAGGALDVGTTGSDASYQVKLLEEENFNLTRKVAALQYELEQVSANSASGAGEARPEGFSEFGQRVFQCVTTDAGVGYRLS